MDEFQLIQRYFSTLSTERPDVIRGVGDDAAVLSVPHDAVLLVSTDSLVLDQHFLSDWDPYVIGYKALACNLSDIAAMGGEPAWVSLALTLPSVDESWLKGFSKGFKALLDKYQVSLIGGDITKGPLQITVTIQGYTKPHQVIQRRGAALGDRIYITGALGEPAYAVSQLKKAAYDSPLFNKLFFPEPRIQHGIALRAFASSAIDISDGLCADLSHILKASEKGARLYQAAVPQALTQLNQKEAIRYALTGGDEYELCFTVPEEKTQKMEKILSDQGLSFYAIGEITDDDGLKIEDNSGSIVNMDDLNGFKHFE